MDKITVARGWDAIKLFSGGWVGLAIFIGLVCVTIMCIFDVTFG